MNSILGSPRVQRARPVAELNDFEEMMLSLVHPFVQVYTIPTTGELAFAGHVCNFRQKVHEWVKELPVRPKNMPYVLVKPRPNSANPDQRPRLPFAVDVHKVKAAYEWLKINNPHYSNVEWNEDNAKAWEDGSEQVPTREEEMNQHVTCTMGQFKRWMESATEAGTGDGLQTASSKCRAAFGTDSSASELWSAVKEYMGGYFRVMQSLTSQQLYMAIEVKTERPHEKDYSAAVRAMRDEGVGVDGLNEDDPEQWPGDYRQLLAELVATRIAAEEEAGGNEQHELGAVEPDEPEGDEEERLNAIEAYGKKGSEETGNAVLPVLSGSPKILFEDGVQPEANEEAEGLEMEEQEIPEDEEEKETAEPEEEGRGKEKSGGPRNRQRNMDRRTRKRLPKVDAPAVMTDNPIREDENDYIAKAFIRIFPFGIGDYYTVKERLQAAPKFANWAKYVLQYHDGRASRHPRFKYYCLNTRLRVKTPGMRSVFYRFHEQAQDLTLQDMKNPDIRRGLLYKMSTVTAVMPGSVGEKARMRQELETMVEQKETETAEAGENAGLGRTPALFTTCTTAPYKWEQLHSKILQSLSPELRRPYERWKLKDSPEEREMERRTCYWEAAIENPAVVSWYSAWRLEATLKTIMQSLTAAMQKLEGVEECKSRIREHLRECLGVQDAELHLPDPSNWGEVDDYWATYEWSEGGLIHLHIAFWVVGSPRIDVVKIADEEEKTDQHGKSVKEFYFEDEPQVILDSESWLQFSGRNRRELRWFIVS